MNDHPRYLLTLRPTKQPVPSVVSLRRLLKCLGRVYGLACESVSEVRPPAKPPHADGAGGTNGDWDGSRVGWDGKRDRRKRRRF